MVARLREDVAAILSLRHDYGHGPDNGVRIGRLEAAFECAARICDTLATAAPSLPAHDSASSAKAGMHAAGLVAVLGGSELLADCRKTAVAIRRMWEARLRFCSPDELRGGSSVKVGAAIPMTTTPGEPELEAGTYVLRIDNRQVDAAWIRFYLATCDFVAVVDPLLKRLLERGRPDDDLACFAAAATAAGVPPWLYSALPKKSKAGARNEGWLRYMPAEHYWNIDDVRRLLVERFVKPGIVCGGASNKALRGELESALALIGDTVNSLRHDVATVEDEVRQCGGGVGGCVGGLYAVLDIMKRARVCKWCVACIW
jgi:hypothetical protein